MIKATTADAYRLMHEGAIALADVEANGMRVDLPRLEQTITEVKTTIKEMEVELKKDEIYTAWRKRYGAETNLGSRPQLAKILFEVLKIPYDDASTPDDEAVEEDEKYSAKEDILERVNLPFTKMYLRMEKHKKLLSTNLLGIRREVEGDRIHPFFNLHLVKTFRSSSDSINFQNIPVRDLAIASIVRSLFIASKGHRIVEIDFSGIEVHGAAWYHKDPTMLRYIREGYDMHRDMAGECYVLPKGAVPKPCRQQAKSLFVFAQFYGDYYIACARSLWDACERYGLKTEEGVPMKEHLKDQGIYELGLCDPRQRAKANSYEAHIKAVEDRFWNERFAVYNQWRKDWYRKYKSQGGFDMLTGFHVEGVFTRNEVINWPVQGIAFHCLLWALIQLNRWLKKHKMRSKIVGQIHDSIVGDIHEDEYEDYMAAANHFMTVAIKRHWQWIITPIAIEAEASPVDGNWYEKKGVKLVA